MRSGDVNERATWYPDSRDPVKVLLFKDQKLVCDAEKGNLLMMCVGLSQKAVLYSSSVLPDEGRSLALIWEDAPSLKFDQNGTALVRKLIRFGRATTEDLRLIPDIEDALISYVNFLQEVNFHADQQVLKLISDLAQKMRGIQAGQLWTDLAPFVSDTAESLIKEFEKTLGALFLKWEQGNLASCKSAKEEGHVWKWFTTLLSRPFCFLDHSLCHTEVLAIYDMRQQGQVLEPAIMASTYDMCSSCERILAGECARMQSVLFSRGLERKYMAHFESIMGTGILLIVIPDILPMGQIRCSSRSSCLRIQLTSRDQSRHARFLGLRMKWRLAHIVANHVTTVIIVRAVQFLSPWMRYRKKIEGIVMLWAIIVDKHQRSQESFITANFSSRKT